MREKKQECNEVGGAECGAVPLATPAGSAAPSAEAGVGEEGDAERFVAMCKALGHPARLEIFRRLLALNRCVCGEIVEMLPLAQSTVSEHLRVLKQAGLVRGEVDGPRTCYCVDKQGLAFFRAVVARDLRLPGVEWFA